MNATAATVLEKPMLFSSSNVPKLLDGSKGQTRRVALKNPNFNDHYEFDGWCGRGLTRAAFKLSKRCKEFPLLPPSFGVNCPHPVGSLAWVRETYRTINDPATCIGNALDIDYRADGEERIMDRFNTPDRIKWKPAIFMPRWASRITLEITGVRVERLQSISADDAIAEGIPPESHLCDCTVCAHTPTLCPATQSSLIMAYAELWDSINRKAHPWASNCWVWCYEFKRIKP